jgi:hypothetical protein
VERGEKVDPARDSDMRAEQTVFALDVSLVLLADVCVLLYLARFLGENRALSALCLVSESGFSQSGLHFASGQPSKGLRQG